MNHYFKNNYYYNDLYLSAIPINIFSQFEYYCVENIYTGEDENWKTQETTVFPTCLFSLKCSLWCTIYYIPTGNFYEG